MKNFTRLFDLERTQRDGKADSPPDLARHEDANIADISAATHVFQTPAIDVDPAVLERERILSPGAGGENGAPYKLLRTQTLRRLAQLGATTLAVISPTAADGKTLTAINLAIAIAATAGRTALVVDFDLRSPSLASRFGFEPGVGVEECLESRRPIHEALVRIRGYERLTLLPAKSRVEHSSELLSASRVGEIVTEIRTRYANRVILFDLPPVLQADDALAFSQHMQAALLVVGERHTKREDVARSLELLRDTPVVGTVLNQSRTREKRYY